MGFNISDMLGTPSVGGVQANKVVILELNSLVPYHNHRFRLYEGERLEDMVQSIKQNGILSPIIARTTDEVGKFEILAGHNRCNAAKIAGLTAVPCIIKENLNDDEAEMYVIETNAMQRGFNDLSTSEQAAVIALRHSKMFNDDKAAAIRSELQAIENGNDETSAEEQIYTVQNGKSKLAATGTEYGLSKNSVARLIRVNTLTDELKQSIDLNLLPVRAGVEFSYISESAQQAIFDFFKETVIKNNQEYQAVRIDMKTAAMLRDMFRDFSGSQETALKMLESYAKGVSDKPKKPKSHKLKNDICSKYFDNEESDEYINSIIDEALQMYFERENAQGA